jgi:hypothetical protein
MYLFDSSEKDLTGFIKTDENKKGLPVSPAKDRPVGQVITPERGA